MSVLPTRSAVAITFALGLRRAALPTLGTAIVAWLGATSVAPVLTTGATAPGALTSWLLLPLVVAVAMCTATAITAWPTFCAGAPGASGSGAASSGAVGSGAEGADWIRRLQRGPLRGSGGAIAGALLAQLVLTLPLTMVLPRLLGAPAAITARLTLTPATDAPVLLAPGQQALPFELPGAGKRALAAIELRPLAGPPGATLAPSRVVVRAGNEPLTSTSPTAPAATAVFDQTGQFARIDFEPRTVTRIELLLESGNVPLFFPPGAVLGIEATPRSGLLNGALAALLWLLPALTVLAFANLAGAAAARPTVLTVAFALLFILSVAGIGPGHATLLALLRGYWLPTSPAFATLATTALASFGGLAAAVAVRWRLAR